MKWLVGKVRQERTNQLDNGASEAARADAIKLYFDSERHANDFAKAEAIAHPNTQYAVYGIVRVFETTTPSIIEKVIDTDGQLVPVLPA